MSIINVLIVLVIVGFLLWLVNNFIPMAGSIKMILNALVVVLVILWLLQLFGVLPGNFGNFRLK